MAQHNLIPFNYDFSDFSSPSIHSRHTNTLNMQSLIWVQRLRKHSFSMLTLKHLRRVIPTHCSRPKFMLISCQPSLCLGPRWSVSFSFPLLYLCCKCKTLAIFLYCQSRSSLWASTEAGAVSVVLCTECSAAGIVPGVQLGNSKYSILGELTNEGSKYIKRSTKDSNSMSQGPPEKQNQ